MPVLDSRRPGRPRLRRGERADGDLAAEIRDAAAALFIDRGYSATSTRAIADSVGVTQAALYYHFRSKEDLLIELLMGVIARPVQIGLALQERAEPASTRFSMLIRSDVLELMTSRHNVGSLFLLPEVRQPRLGPFREQRQLLRSIYAGLIEECIREDRLLDLPQAPGAGSSEAHAILIDAVFGLVESAITIRADRPDADPVVIADGLRSSALRLLGYDDSAIRAIAGATTEAGASI